MKLFVKKVEETRNIYHSMYFDILNHLGLDCDCDGETDGTAFINIARILTIRVRLA